jgi:hypothetical protein
MPTEGSQVILAFRSLFSKKVFEHVKVLLLGAVLTVGKHTVCAAPALYGPGTTRLFSQISSGAQQSQLVRIERIKDIVAHIDKVFCQ